MKTVLTHQILTCPYSYTVAGMDFVNKYGKFLKKRHIKTDKRIHVSVTFVQLVISYLVLENQVFIIMTHCVRHKFS